MLISEQPAKISRRQNNPIYTFFRCISQFIRTIKSGLNVKYQPHNLIYIRTIRRGLADLDTWSDFFFYLSWHKIRKLNSKQADLFRVPIYFHCWNYTL